MIDGQAREQMRRATEAIRALVLEVAREGRVHPMALVLALAQTAGELEAGAARASGEAVGLALEELAGVLRESGMDHEARLALAELTVAGNA